MNRKVFGFDFVIIMSLDEYIRAGDIDFSVFSRFSGRLCLGFPR